MRVRGPFEVLLDVCSRVVWGFRRAAVARCLRSRASALALDGATSPCAGPPPKGEPATGNFLRPKPSNARAQRLVR